MPISEGQVYALEVEADNLLGPRRHYVICSIIQVKKRIKEQADDETINLAYLLAVRELDIIKTERNYRRALDLDAERRGIMNKYKTALVAHFTLMAENGKYP